MCSFKAFASWFFPKVSGLLPSKFGNLWVKYNWKVDKRTQNEFSKSWLLVQKGLIFAHDTYRVSKLLCVFNSAAPKVMPPALWCWPTVSVGCWRDGSNGWAFPPICCYILFLCDARQQRGSLTEWQLTWKCVWSKGLSLNSSMWKKMAPIDIPWCLLNVYADQAADVSTVRQWVACFSSGNSDRLFIQAFHYRALQIVSYYCSVLFFPCPPKSGMLHKRYTGDILWCVAFAYTWMHNFNIGTYHCNNRREIQNLPLLICTFQSLVSLCTVI